MADQPPNSRAGEDTTVGSDRESKRGMPRWVKVTGIIVGILILLAVVLMMFLGGGQHGPQRHVPGNNAGSSHEDDAAPIDGVPELAVIAGALRFDPDRIELPAGMPVNVALTSTDTLHDLVVEEVDFHLSADRDETAVGGLTFDEPGTYVGYCSVPGHREEGMEFEFVVTAAGAGHSPPVEH